MAKFRKKPVIIEAMQFDGTVESARAICAWTNMGIEITCDYVTKDGVTAYDFFVHTLEGIMEAGINYWIICGVKGEFYPCKPDIFEVTYDKVDDAEKETDMKGNEDER